MNDKYIKILLIEDNTGDARLIGEMLHEVKDFQFHLECSDTLASGLAYLAEAGIDVVLLDLSLPDSSGLATFEKVSLHSPDLPVIILTGFDNEMAALKAVEKRAQDYLVKGQINGNLLIRSIQYAICRKRAEEQLTRYRYHLEELVKERTAELIIANTQLQQEITERKKFEEERKKMEEELQKMDRLEAIGILAGGIAHDFNNLLTGIIGNLSLAELYVKPGDTLFEIVKRAQKASMHASQLTQQLLTFSKGGAPIKETVFISELLTDAATLALRGSNVRCESYLPDDLWPVEIDKGQIGQVINNLIINADQAMPEGGIIKIRAENISRGEHNSLPLKEGKYVEISVKDQGTGLPKELLSKIFDPYFTTKQKGSGLGLATCYSIIKKHGGYISVESELGVGTTFTFFLPASEKEIFKVEEPQEEGLFFNKGRILLMDDKQDVIDTAEQMLFYLGYEVETARTGTEAIENYKRAKESKRPFDAIILDLTVPGGMGGKEAIQRLLEIDSDVKAIVSSGYSNNPVMSEYTQYGFLGIVTKPYKIKELSKVLYSVLSGDTIKN